MTIVVVVWCVGVTVLLPVLFRAAAARSARVLGMPAAPAGMPLVGGLRSRTLNATWPLARLEFHDWGIRLTGSAFLVRGWLIPTWEARYAELAEAGLIKGPVPANRGVRFRCQDGGPPIVFWTGRGEEVLDHMAERGVPVNRSVSRLPWIGL